MVSRTRLFEHNISVESNSIEQVISTVTRKSIGHIGFLKKIITSIVATNLKFELNIVDI